VTRRALILPLALAPVLAPFAACSSEGTVVPGDAGPVEEASVGPDRVAPPRDANADATEAGVVYDENGWVRLDFDPGGACGFYAAPSPDKMPPPIQWEPCTSQAKPAGIACRQLKADWTSGPNRSSPHGWALGGVESSGVVNLSIARFMMDRVYRIVAEADGPTRLAVVERNSICTLGSSASVRGGHVVYTAVQSDSVSFARSGAIGGAINEVPRVLRSEPNTGQSIHPAFVAGASGFFEWGPYGYRVWNWAATQSAPVSTADPGQLGSPCFQGDALCFQMANLAYARIKVYTPDAGAQDLISYGNDVAHNAADFGTDGKDMVWDEGVGRANNQEPFAAVNIMTAPFTTDAATTQAQKRRLRSETAYGFLGQPYAVGCGYAIHSYTAINESGVRLVRISDGRSWVMATPPGPFYWTAPVAVTCDEVFINFVLSGQTNLGRVRIDSLGPGDPPD
jgi:hypothetical protein